MEKMDCAAADDDESSFEIFTWKSLQVVGLIKCQGISPKWHVHEFRWKHKEWLEEQFDMFCADF